MVFGDSVRCPALCWLEADCRWVAKLSLLLGVTDDEVGAEEGAVGARLVVRAENASMKIPSIQS